MQRFKNWIPALIVMALIFLLSAIEGPVIDQTGLGKESYHLNGHFIVYFLLGLAFYKATKDLILSVELALLYGTLDEIHQIMVPGRSWETVDMLVDLSGAGIANILIWKNLLPQKLRNWLEK